jgi:streptogramin lyase
MQPDIMLGECKRPSNYRVLSANVPSESARNRTEGRHLLGGLSRTVLTLLLLTMAACGGGGNSGTPGPPPVTGSVAIVSGDHQSTFSGGTLLQLLDVRVSWVGGSTSQVTFASSTGVEIFPSQVTVASNSVLHEARAFVRLPDIPFSTFVITATASTGGSVQFSAFTGPHLVQVFGNASGYHGSVAADGTYYAGGAGGADNTGDQSGAAVFNPDGSLRAFLGSPLGKLNVLDPGGFAGNALITPDQSVYFNHGDYIERFDSNLNLLSFADTQSQATTNDPRGIDQWFTADAAGNLYGIAGEIEVYNSQGVVTRKIPIASGVAYYGIAVNSAGNVVVALYDGVTSKLREYDANDTPIDHVLPTTSLRAMSQDSRGNYILYDGSSVVVMNEQYQTVQTITSSNSVFSNGFLSGIDDLGNVYFSYGGGITKFDSNGNLVWLTAAPDILPVPIGLTRPVYVSPFQGNTAIGGMAVNPSNGEVYVQNSGVTVFDQGVYKSFFQFSAPGPPESIAMSSTGNVYQTFGYGSSPSGIAVYDPLGNPIKNMSFSQVGIPSGIAIDSTDTKFVVDITNRLIHQFDSQDNYVGSITLNVSASTTIQSGGIALDPSGNLVVCLATVDTSTNPGTNPGYLKKISRSGAELWSSTISPSESPVRNVALDTLGRIYLLRTLALEVRDPSGNLLAQVDLNDINGGGDDRLIPMASDGDRIYFYSTGKIYVVSPQ